MAAYADAPDAEELREYLSDGEEEPSFDEPPLRKDMDSAIVVANLPSVDAAKVVKVRRRRRRRRRRRPRPRPAPA
jgi:hypothetical protein